jgi:hypothetical protein
MPLVSFILTALAMILSATESMTAKIVFKRLIPTMNTGSIKEMELAMVRATFKGRGGMESTFCSGTKYKRLSKQGTNQIGPSGWMFGPFCFLIRLFQMILVSNCHMLPPDSATKVIKGSSEEDDGTQIPPSTRAVEEFLDTWRYLLQEDIKAGNIESYDEKTHQRYEFRLRTAFRIEQDKLSRKQSTTAMPTPGSSIRFAYTPFSGSQYSSFQETPSQQPGNMPRDDKLPPLHSSSPSIRGQSSPFPVGLSNSESSPNIVAVNISSGDSYQARSSTGSSKSTTQPYLPSDPRAQIPDLTPGPSNFGHTMGSRARVGVSSIQPYSAPIQPLLVVSQGTPSSPQSIRPRQFHHQSLSSEHASQMAHMDDTIHPPTYQNNPFVPNDFSQQAFLQQENSIRQYPGGESLPLNTTTPNEAPKSHQSWRNLSFEQQLMQRINDMEAKLNAQDAEMDAKVEARVKAMTSSTPKSVPLQHEDPTVARSHQVGPIRSVRKLGQRAHHVQSSAAQRVNTFDPPRPDLATSGFGQFWSEGAPRAGSLPHQHVSPRDLWSKGYAYSDNGICSETIGHSSHEVSRGMDLSRVREPNRQDTLGVSSANTEAQFGGITTAGRHLIQGSDTFSLYNFDDLGPVTITDSGDEHFGQNSENEGMDTNFWQ